jgi:hypothetical protein
MHRLKIACANAKKMETPILLEGRPPLPSAAGTTTDNVNIREVAAQKQSTTTITTTGSFVVLDAADQLLCVPRMYQRNTVPTDNFTCDLPINNVPPQEERDEKKVCLSLKRKFLYQSTALRKNAKRVRFDRDPVTKKIRNERSKEDLKSLWSSRCELEKNRTEAGEALRNVSIGSKHYTKGVIRLFQECSSKQSNISKLLSSCESTLLNPPREDLRGLERQMHKGISQYRTFHVRTLLKQQQTLTKKSETHQRMLRSISLNTSRVSRVWAIVLAHGDSIQVVNMVREEIGSFQPISK